MGLGEIGGEDVDGVVAKVCDLCVEARDFGGTLSILTRTAGATSPLTLEPAQLAESMFKGPRVGEFINNLADRRDRRQSPHPHVDANHGVRLGDVGLLGTSDTHPQGRNNALSLARDRDPKNFGPIKCDERRVFSCVRIVPSTGKVR